MEFPDLSNSRAAVRAFRKGFRSGEVALAKFEEVSFECEYEPAEEVIARELEEQARREEELYFDELASKGVVGGGADELRSKGVDPSQCLKQLEQELSIERLEERLMEQDLWREDDMDWAELADGDGIGDAV